MARQRALTLIVAAIAIAFFIWPIALRAVGVKAQCCPENRHFSPAPKLADGFKAFDETTRFLIDRMPGRQRAVRANTWIAQNIWSTTPHYGKNAIGGVAADQALPFTGRPQQDQTDLNAIDPSKPGAGPPPLPGDLSPVSDGKHGWMYLTHDFDHACHLYVPIKQAMSQWLDFVHTIRASGRRVVLVVVADKSTIYPEFVKAGTPDLACSGPGKARLWRTVDQPSVQRAGVIGLRGALRSAKATTSAPIYYPKDSHWNSVGALTLPEAVVPELDPKIHVTPNEIVDTGAAPHVGDLTALLGAPQTDVAPTRVIRRAAGAPVIGGHSVLVGDSFSDAAYPLLAPYFSDLVRAEWDKPPADLIANLNRADTVVLEVIEWQFDYYPSKFGAIKPAVRRLVAQQLTKR